MYRRRGGIVRDSEVEQDFAKANHLFQELDSLVRSMESGGNWLPYQKMGVDGNPTPEMELRQRLRVGYEQMADLNVSMSESWLRAENESLNLPIWRAFKGGTVGDR